MTSSQNLLLGLSNELIASILPAIVFKEILLLIPHNYITEYLFRTLDVIIFNIKKLPVSNLWHFWKRFPSFCY